ncbi:hypothetical protein [Croceicoccus mobilis]|nr:hypothetical protein [Croceicoccus mobilis]
MKKMPAFGEPRLDADLASIIAASEAAGKPKRAITTPYQKRVVVVAAVLAICAIGLAEWLSEPAPAEPQIAAREPYMPTPLPGNASPLALLEEPQSAEGAVTATSPRQARPVQKIAPRPSAKTIWYDQETAADDAFGKASAQQASAGHGSRPKATTVFFDDDGSPQARTGKQGQTEKEPATLALGTE